MSSIFEDRRFQPQIEPQLNDVRVRDSIYVFIKGIYFIHLVTILIYSTLLIILEPRVRIEFTSSLAIIVVYGFMAFWLLLFNWITVVIHKERVAIWCSRFISKVILMLYPIFFFFAYLHDHFLFRRSVITFMLYQLFISIMMIIFEIYTCTCGHHEQPRYLYAYNELSHHHEDVLQRKTQYNQIKLKQKSMSLSV